MPASPQDFYKKVGANTVTTLAAPGKNLAATSINVGATTNYPTDTGIVVGIRVVDSNGTIVPGTYTEWNAVVASSTAITIEAVPVYGTDQVYPAGSLTQVFLMVSSSLHNQMVDGLLVSHNQDGTLKNNTVTTAAITDASVTAAKTAFGGDYSTSEVDTGFKWVDGKVIYKRTFTGTITQGAGGRNSVTLTTVDKVLKYDGYYNEDGTIVVTIGSQRMSGAGVVDDSDALLVVSGSATLYTKTSVARTSQPYAVTLYYTKT